MRVQPGPSGGGAWGKPLLHPRPSRSSQCILATSTWSRVLASCKQDSEVSRGQRAGGIGALGPAHSNQANGGPPHRRAAGLVPSLDHDQGVMGLIYCRKPLKAQELWRASDNRHKARI